MGVADKLREARALIERGWTQDFWARDALGRPVLEYEEEAVCWCARGAIFVACRGRDSNLREECESVMRDVINDFIPGWNDAPERTQAEVLAAFDKAIELAEAQS